MAGYPGIRRVNLRYDPLMGDDGTFLLRCDDCASKGKSTAYWPLTLEFWAPYSLQRCRACANAKKRGHPTQTPLERRATIRRWYKENHEERLAYARAYLAANREKVNEQRRKRHAAKMEKRRVQVQEDATGASGGEAAA